MRPNRYATFFHGSLSFLQPKFNASSGTVVSRQFNAQAGVVQQMSMQLSSRQNLFYHTLQLSLWNPIPFHTHGPRRGRTAYATRIKMILIVLDFSNSQYHIYKIVCGVTILAVFPSWWNLLSPQELSPSRLSLSSMPIPTQAAQSLLSSRTREESNLISSELLISVLNIPPFTESSGREQVYYPVLTAAHRGQDIFIYRNQYYSSISGFSQLVLESKPQISSQFLYSLSFSGVVLQPISFIMIDSLSGTRRYIIYYFIIRVNH